MCRAATVVATVKPTCSRRVWIADGAHRYTGRCPGARWLFMLFPGEKPITGTQVWLPSRWHCAVLQAPPLQLQPSTLRYAQHCLLGAQQALQLVMHVRHMLRPTPWFCVRGMKTGIETPVLCEACVLWEMASRCAVYRQHLQSVVPPTPLVLPPFFWAPACQPAGHCFASMDGQPAAQGFVTAQLHDKQSGRSLLVAATHLKAKADNEHTRVHQVSRQPRCGCWACAAVPDQATSSVFH